MLSKGSIRYLEEISGTLGKIAEGNFDIQIPKRSNDELGLLAENINQMTRKLKQSIEEERNAELTKMNWSRMYHMICAPHLLLFWVI